jgi:hypothetical protein
MRSAGRARRINSARAMPSTVCAMIPEPTTKISVSQVDCQKVGSLISRVKLASPVNWNDCAVGPISSRFVKAR